MSNSTYNEEEECRECKALLQEKPKEVVKDDFKYNIGDVLTVQPPTIGISSPARPDIIYKEHLRVVFRFWDGGAHVYVVEAEDGIGMFMMEQDAALESHGHTPELQPEQPKGHIEEQKEKPHNCDNMRDIPSWLYDKLDKLGIIPNVVRGNNVGASDDSQHVIQPWAIWQEYNLNPWDADIVKRVLRHKATDTRKMDYEKIIHICQERIRQIENEKKED